MNLNKFLTISIFYFISFGIYADYVVQTSSGITDGYKGNRVIHWDDIPYAQAPVNELRWKAPREITNSDTVIVAKENNFCVQRPSSLGAVSYTHLTLPTIYSV